MWKCGIGLRPGPSTCVQNSAADLSEAPDVRNYELLVNSTSVGLQGEDPFAELPFEASHLEQRHTVVDLVYGEEPSRLLAVAGSAGATTVDGIEVLVRQGALSLEIWTGSAPSLEIMRDAARIA